MIHQLKNASKGGNYNDKMPRADKYSTFSYMSFLCHPQLEHFFEIFYKPIRQKEVILMNCSKSISCLISNLVSFYKSKWILFGTFIIKLNSIEILLPKIFCPVDWGCRIHWLLLCKEVRPPPPPPIQVDMTLNNLMVRFQWCWNFGECGTPLHCHLS